MNRIKSKVYYEISTGIVLNITSECEGPVENTTKEQDINLLLQVN